MASRNIRFNGLWSLPLYMRRCQYYQHTVYVIVNRSVLWERLGQRGRLLVFAVSWTTAHFYHKTN